jgi:hypothetical protein
MSAQDTASFDNSVRLAIYQQFVAKRRAPSVAEVAKSLTSPVPEIKAAYERLATAHVIVLQPESGEILMANPLSAVPTGFEVATLEGRFWGNCIWDGMGIIAMLGGNGEVETSCGCCSESMRVEIREGRLLPGRGVIHFAISAAHWWDDIVFN